MNSTSDFFDFISGLSNLEKTRNFNVFTGYSLEPFANVLKKYGFDSRKESSLCRISVVGTNAKGSITHFLGEYFRLSGFKTGLYTSPHLISPLERIRIGDPTNPFRKATEKELNELLNEWKILGAETDLKTFPFSNFSPALRPVFSKGNPSKSRSTKPDSEEDWTRPNSAIRTSSYWEASDSITRKY